MYVALALSFNGWIYWQSGEERAIQFLTGYFIEYALSMDNILVFVVILAYFQVPAELQMRVLLWGVIGSVILRGIFILAGLALIEAFDWTMLVLGFFLIYTGIKTIKSGDEAEGSPKKPDHPHCPAFHSRNRRLPRTKAVYQAPW